MPITKSAKKAMRVALKKRAQNQAVLAKIKKIRKQKKIANLAEAYSVVDKAVKKNIIHKNKAARLKSQLARLASASDSEPRRAKLANKEALVEKKPTKAITKKTTIKKKNNLK